MKTTNEKHTELLEANINNIQASFQKMREYTDAKGYRIIGDMKLPTNLIGITKGLDFESKKQEKVLRNYINRLHKGVNMQTANKFLHFLFKRVYKLDNSPYIDYSEKELKIKESRKAWKKAQAESDKLHLAYKLEKGDFYKKPLVV